MLANAGWGLEMNAIALPLLAAAHLKGPHVDFGGLSPLIALLGGATLVLLLGLLRPRWVRAQAVPAVSLVALGAALGAGSSTSGLRAAAAFRR